MRTVILLLFCLCNLMVTSAHAYECKAVELKWKNTKDKKSFYVELKKANRLSVIQDLLFILTQAEIKNKSGIKRVNWQLDYLENTEINSDFRAFFKLLKVTSEIENNHLKKLQINEVCEIMNKVNSL